MKFEKEVLFPAAGLDPNLAEEYYAVQEMTKELSYAVNEAARQLHQRRDRRGRGRGMAGEIRAHGAEAGAAAGASFIEQYRSYVINYNLGEDMVRQHVEKRGGTAEHGRGNAGRFSRNCSPRRGCRARCKQITLGSRSDGIRETQPLTRHSLSGAIPLCV